MTNNKEVRIKAIVEDFIIRFLQENSSRCLDDADDSDAVAQWIRKEIYETSAIMAKIAIEYEPRE